MDCPSLNVSLSWLSFLVGIGCGVLLLAVVLHYVDKAMKA